MELLRRAILDCNHKEVSFQGLKHTWCKREGADRIFKRLNRGLATEESLQKFPKVVEYHLMSIRSDHSPILFALDCSFCTSSGKKRLFHFENVWLKYEDCQGVVEGSWAGQEVATSIDLAAKVKDCA
ncbi:hypothetical protein PTKIN_Ptkin02bG0092500 [Pterospermum kingtungense]